MIDGVTPQVQQAWVGTTTGHGLVIFYLAGLAVMLWLLNQAKRSFWLCSLLALPGTLCHEACHWLVGKLLHGEPVHFTVFPRREGRGFVLGSVAFRNLRWYNAFFVGLAPLVLLPLTYGLLLWRLGSHPRLDWSEAIVVFFLANLVFAALPSWQDLKIAARSPVGWLLLGAALVAGWMKIQQPDSASPSQAPPSATRSKRAPGDQKRSALGIGVVSEKHR
jgi:hypothetical protein